MCLTRKKHLLDIWAVLSIIYSWNNCVFPVSQFAFFFPNATLWTLPSVQHSPLAHAHAILLSCRPTSARCAAQWDRAAPPCSMGFKRAQEATRPPTSSIMALFWCRLHRTHAARSRCTYTVTLCLYFASWKLQQELMSCSWNSWCQTTCPLEWHFKLLRSNGSMTKHAEKILNLHLVSWQALVNISFPSLPSPSLLLLSATVTKKGSN